MNRIDEYKDKMNWDMWEDIQRVKENAEKKPHENPLNPNKSQFDPLKST